MKKKNISRLYRSQEKYAEALNATHRKPSIEFNAFREQGTDYCSHRTESCQAAFQVAMVQDHLRMLQEMLGKTWRPQYPLCREYHSGVLQLLQLFEVLQSEEAAGLGGLSTSFASVETLIAKCISECLSGCSSRSRNMHKILSLVRDYRVVRPLQDGSCSVSLLQIHSILQDNYKDSYLCILFDILLGCRSGIASKAVEL